MKALSRHISEVVQSSSILFELVRQQLILRYRRTALGFLWTLINPLLMMSITAVVFAHLFRMDIRTYALYLFAGLVPWNLFASMLTQSANAYISNEGLMRKIYIPRLVFPLSVTVGALIDSMLAFLSLMLLFAFIGAEFSVALFFIPVAYLLLYLFALGVSVSISLFTVFFRDLQQVISVSLQALFFFTPVMYKVSDLGEAVAQAVELNPMTHFIELFRAPIYAHTLPAEHNLMVVLCWVVLSLGLGFVSFSKLQSKIIFRL
jgi:ABC-type polysaccharide/polyol phosphate export permease